MNRAVTKRFTKRSKRRQAASRRIAGAAAYGQMWAVGRRGLDVESFHHAAKARPRRCSDILPTEGTIAHRSQV